MKFSNKLGRAGDMKIRGYVSLIGLACSLLAPLAVAEQEQVTLNFVNADIDSVVKAVGLITGKNFIIDPRVKGTVNIVSAKPVPRELTYQILLSALRLQGFAAVEGQGVVKILPEADAKQNFSVTTGKSVEARGDRIVTQVYPLQYESANQLLPILRPLISPNNTIAAYPNTNTLVITDYADNVKRINKIIDSIDQPGGGEVTMIKLKHASAVDLAQQLTRLVAEGWGAGTKICHYA
jgi:general secretion pathway protein D